LVIVAPAGWPHHVNGAWRVDEQDIV